VAIGSNRIKSKSVVDLIDKKFISVIDKTKDTLANNAAGASPKAASSKKSTDTGKSSIFSKQETPSPSSKSLASGDTASPVAAKLVTTVSPSGDRSMSTPFDINGGSNNKISLALDTNMNILTKGMPDSKVNALESMIHERVTAMTRGVSNLSGIDKQSTVLKGIGMVSKYLSTAGATLGDKSLLGSLLSCVNNSGMNGNESSLMMSLVVNLMLSQSLCMSPTKMLNSIDSLVSGGTTSNQDIITGAISSFIGASKLSPSVRIDAINSLESHTGPITASISAQTKGMTKSLLESLDGNSNSTNRTKDHTSTMLALNKLSPGWDSPNGDPTMVKGNRYINNLSLDYLKSSSLTPSAVPVDPAPLTTGDPKLLAILISAQNQHSKSIVNSSSIVA